MTMMPATMLLMRNFVWISAVTMPAHTPAAIAAKRGQHGRDAGDQQGCGDRTAERIAALRGQVGKPEEAERDQHAEAEEAGKRALLQHVDDQGLKLGCHVVHQCAAL